MNGDNLHLTLLKFESSLFHSVFLFLWEEWKCARVGEVDKNEWMQCVVVFVLVHFYIFSFFPSFFALSLSLWKEFLANQWRFLILNFLSNRKKWRSCGRRCPFYPLFTLGWTNVHMSAASLCLTSIWVMGRDEHEQRESEEGKKKKKPYVFVYLISRKERERERKERRKEKENDLRLFLLLRSILVSKEKPD